MIMSAHHVRIVGIAPVARKGRRNVHRVACRCIGGEGRRDHDAEHDDANNDEHELRSPKGANYRAHTESQCRRESTLHYAYP
jgi:hypothetical protein